MMFGSKPEEQIERRIFAFDELLDYVLGFARGVESLYFILFFVKVI